ncbi:MAG TPA: dipeptidase [Actinomycetota bacterium]|nr:dipeptidase [Actinomycetota bacterium]
MPDIGALLPQIRADLEELVRIPSVSADGFDPAHVRASASKTLELFEAEGLSTELLEIDGAHPAVLATFPAPAGAPTVLLYAHHDVQPPGEESKWTSPPFEPTERDGRLYGRGTADDKAGIMVHLAAIRAFEGTPPVGLTILIEGEEETGSEHLGAFLSAYGDRLRADAIVLADSGNWRIGEPALTTSLRGLVDCVVEVRTLDHAVHSGMYGGPIPDALTCLARLLSTLHDPDGNVAVGTRVHGSADPLDLTEDELRAQAGVADGVRMIGGGALTERLWARPAISVLGIDAPTVQAASNQLVPVARAKISMRIAPGDDPSQALDELVAHLERNAPWGAKVTVRRGSTGRPYALKADGPIYEAARQAMTEAWDGKKPVHMGVGGSIPLVAAFADRYPDAAILLTGVEDPDTRAHGENESLHLGEFARAIRAETLLLEHLGAR